METNKSKLKLTKDSPIVKIIAVVIFAILGLATKYPYDVVSWIINLLYLTVLILFIILVRDVYKRSESGNWNNYAYLIYMVLGCAFIISFTPWLQKKVSPIFIDEHIVGKKGKFWVSTKSGENVWIRLKLNPNKTYEIWSARPNSGTWGTSSTGQLSNVTKQRYTDNGKTYYAIYLENFPFHSDRTMIAFTDAFDDQPSYKSDNLHFILSSVDNENPWDND
jgi:amino acid transporter